MEFVPKLLLFLVILIVGLIIAKAISKALNIAVRFLQPLPRCFIKGTTLLENNITDKGTSIRVQLKFLQCVSGVL
ncbi:MULTISPECIES: mechanosensitive ion channel family protein [Micrococcaceae]|uniref:mechanosensitive ion channel family protein n=1 Tax=Micrococcaceae TaxID=1268 RepID=UPI000ABE9BB7|nr:hypothetical protein [Arthrobacter sp. Soil761]